MHSIHILRRLHSYRLFVLFGFELRREIMETRNRHLRAGIRILPSVSSYWKYLIHVSMGTNVGDDLDERKGPIE